MDRVERKYYPDGTLQEEAHYRGKQWHGPWRRWHPNGVLAQEYWFEEGVYWNGTNRQWYANGQLACEQTVLNGKQVGRFLIYDEHGKPVVRQYVLESRAVSRSKYEAACRLRPELPRYTDPDPPSAKPARPKRSKKRKAAPTGEIPPDDSSKFFDELLAAESAEALEWLKVPPSQGIRTLGEMGPDMSLEFVEKLYDTGAAEVVAVKIEHVPGTDDQTTNHLVVRLPADADARTSLFELESEHAESEGFDGETDRGQAYLYFKLC